MFDYTLVFVMADYLIIAPQTTGTTRRAEGSARGVLWGFNRSDAISSILAVWDRVMPNSCLPGILPFFIFPCLWVSVDIALV